MFNKIMHTIHDINQLCRINNEPTVFMIKPEYNSDRLFKDKNYKNHINTLHLLINEGINPQFIKNSTDNCKQKIDALADYLEDKKEIVNIFHEIRKKRNEMFHKKKRLFNMIEDYNSLFDNDYDESYLEEITEKLFKSLKELYNFLEDKFND